MKWTDFTMRNRHDQIFAVTTEERARRIEIVREVMREEGVDIFLLPEDGGTDHLCIWLVGTDHPDMLLVPIEGGIVKIYGENNMTPDTLAFCKETDPLGMTVSADSLDFSYVARMAARKNGRVGIASAASLEAGLVDRLKETVANLELVDIGDAICFRKACKSEFEQQLVWASAHVHQKILEAVPSILRIGRTMKEVSDDIRHLALQMGSTGEDMCLMIHTLDADGKPVEDAGGTYPGRRFTDADIVAVLLETNGPGGYYHALCRNFMFGKPSESFRERYRVAVEANRLAGQLMCPGNTLRKAADIVNDFIRSHGYYTDDCCYLHGMGYTMWEFPGLADNTYGKKYEVSEDMPLVEGMISLAHPHVGYAGNRYTMRDDMVRCIDSYIVAPGGGIRANTMTQDMIQL